MYAVAATVTGDPQDGDSPQIFAMTLFDNRGSAVSDLSLPSLPPEPSDFSAHEIQLVFGAFMHVAGTVDSLALVPEPASLSSLYSILIFGFLKVRRSNRRTVISARRRTEVSSILAQRDSTNANAV